MPKENIRFFSKLNPKAFCFPLRTLSFAEVLQIQVVIHSVHGIFVGVRSQKYSMEVLEVDGIVHLTQGSADCLQHLPTVKNSSSPLVFSFKTVWHVAFTLWALNDFVDATFKSCLIFVVKACSPWQIFLANDNKKKSTIF